ncbi:hypothetical protein TNCV_4276791 [Trichonephila clavipes]|nr:hypothetical protein TNCV_4276791 [Trichonephila clavipes]
MHHVIATVAAEQLLESEDIERQTLGSSYLTTKVTIRKLRLALKDEWAAKASTTHCTLILSMGRCCETCLVVREDHILLMTGCFLLDTHHRDVSAFSRIALHATFSNQAYFYTSDFSFSS